MCRSLRSRRQFFITFAPTAWLDGRHVVFGEVADAAGMAVLARIEALGSDSGAPRGAALVAASGVLDD